MRRTSNVFGNALALCSALVAVSALAPAMARAADTSDRTAMPDFCSNRDVTCVLPDGPPPRLRARGAAATGDSKVVITPPVGSTSTGAGGVGATPSVPSVPAFAGQVPSLPGGVPGLPAQVPGLPSQVPVVSGSVPALLGPVPTAISGTTSTGTTSSSTGTASGTVTGGASSVGPGSVGTHGPASRR